MPKKKKRKHQNLKRRPSPSPARTVNPLTQRMAEINRMKPIMAAAQRTAARQRERRAEQEAENS